MQRLTVDLRMIQSSGIGSYLRQIVPAVMRLLPEVEYFLMGKPGELYKIAWPHGTKREVIAFDAPIYSMGEQWKLLRNLPTPPGLLWVPHYNIPVAHRGRLLVTVYDLIHLAMRQHIEWHKRIYAATLFAAVARKADAVLCISQYTQSELIRMTGIAKEKTHAIPLGIDKSWFEVERERNPHPKPYLLYVGNVKPHKNLVSLIAAFRSIHDRIPHDVVIVGKKDGFITGDAEVARAASELGSRVTFTGAVSDAELRQYYVFADALVFPSLYEGFGFPPLEAMACGCPVIASPCGSLAETCGSAVLYCNPFVPSDIAAKILRLLSDSVLRAELRKRGLEHASTFEWKRCAESTAAVIRSLL